MRRMPRPWEYTRARRIAMQVVMCLLLGASITVAYAVQRIRSAQLAPRQWHPVTAGGFTLELPADWHTDVETAFGGIVEVKSVEQHATLGVTRGLLVYARTLHAKEYESAQDFAADDLDEQFSADDARPIDFLGQHGVLVEVPPVIEPGSIRLGSLRAYVILPSRKGVLVTLAGPARFDPADVELLKRVLNSMQYKPESKHAFRGLSA
jgi:hypothetical protein